MMKNRTDVGIWSPVCVQHGFIYYPSFVSDKYRIPTTTGKHAYEAVQEFVDNPNKAPVYMDKDKWPANTGCDGL